MACSHETVQKGISEKDVKIVQDLPLWYAPKERVVYLRRTQKFASEPVREEWALETGDMFGYVFNYALSELSMYYLHRDETFGPETVKTVLTSNDWSVLTLIVSDCENEKDFKKVTESNPAFEVEKCVFPVYLYENVSRTVEGDSRLLKTIRSVWESKTCPAGVVPLVLSVPRMYYLIQQGKTWTDAQAYCRANHADLAIIESNDNMVHLQNEAQVQQFSSSAWIGMYNDINSWRWSIGNEPLGSFRPWSPGQPNNGGGAGSCVGIGPWGWNDLLCTSLYPIVCFDDTKSGNQRYIYISTSTTWLKALNYCRQYYTDLVSIKTSTEHSYILGLVSGWTWIGLFRDTWKWIDETNVSTISWMPGKPDNALGNENCGYLNKTQAADAKCSDIMPFFCYSDISGKKEVLKVTVQSDQDMNDPAVNAAILKQIKQKLMDHGMAESVTVKWREQPDGVVFHKKKENNTNANQLCDIRVHH